MPLSEFLKFGEQKTSSSLADLSSFSENEVVELVWENGQIVMQGQSNRANKRSPTPTSNNLSLQMPMIREKHKENSSSPKMEKLYLMDEMPLSVPTNEMDDEIVPWVNNNNLQHEYSSELVPEASGLTANAQNNFTLMDKTCGSNQMAVKNSSKVDSSRFGVFPSSSSRIASVPSHKGVLCDNKAVEPGVASSSVCSGSSPDRTSNDQSNSLKRKYCDNEEESGCPSGDFEEEESLGVRKAAAPVRGGTGSKKSRAAEVHNLSERRRRDRINEKMRALQELIPNCNKTDKASMLDEAIEYLKTLQLQVQIMSMGAGFCVPPMMYPLGMHATHFPPMGMGIGPMGMGIHEMNGGYPLYPIPPPMQRAQLSSPPFSWPSTFPGIAASNFPVFGHPGIGIPISTPKPPTISKSGQPATSSAVGLDASRMGIQVQVPCTLKPEDMVKTKSSKLRNNNDPNPLINQTCQIQATTQEQEQNDNQLLHDCDSPAIKLTSSTDVSGSEAGSD